MSDVELSAEAVAAETAASAGGAVDAGVVPEAGRGPAGVVSEAGVVPEAGRRPAGVVSEAGVVPEAGVVSEAGARKPRDLRGALLRYRVLAYVVGAGLVILVLVAMPLKYWADRPALATVVGIAHGYLFMVYLLLTFDLARRAGWRLTRVALVGLAGTIPFLSFYAERKVTGWVRADQPHA